MVYLLAILLSPTIADLGSDALIAINMKVPSPPMHFCNAGHPNRVVVQLRYDVNSEGRIENAEIVSSDPEGYMDEQVLKATEAWRWKPKIVEGQAVTVADQDFRLVFECNDESVDKP